MRQSGKLRDPWGSPAAGKTLRSAEKVKPNRASTTLSGGTGTARDRGAADEYAAPREAPVRGSRCVHTERPERRGVSPQSGSHRVVLVRLGGYSFSQGLLLARVAVWLLVQKMVV
ncbi:hypothetical protein Snoj_30010 [Streptomyces nojiriensis]|uniref:Uncharacterized protein n=1 Tax=Streptomyces nojiriensis TaxID=66374 RepID=A0ABQ3SLS2_9ACTN|nr:hypothetical protein GCM10010205_52190 [Streptomyces nojiriensis]GHI69083.1 hypothetical protein Snoj_30010 [Streptomyces nojiriensis]